MHTKASFIILPSEILSNQGHMTSCAKLSGLLYIKLKIAIQVPKTCIYPSLSCFFNNDCGFWKLTFGHQAKVAYKVRKSVYSIEKFFTCLERSSIFITFRFRTIYRSSFPEVFSKNAFWSRYVAYLQKSSVAVTLLHGCSPVNCLNYS